jgi:aspartyl-tRNA(Asn)/glutamyl-tRNA(Gln) amidotransferase subunit C
MKTFTKEMVDDYANKLLIGLTEEENKMVLDEFDIIDKNIDLVNKIPNIETVEPMTHCLDEYYATLREDVVEESIPIEDLLANSDDTEDREIVVPKVVGGEN